MKYTKGFTLIELLVVISIISSLSSLVFVSVNDTRNKSKISASTVFEKTIDHTLGANAVLSLNFDDCSGAIAKDSSINNNNGTIVGATWSSDTSSPNVSKCSLNFGTGNYITFGKSLNVANSNFTVTGWIKTSQFGQNAKIIGDVGSGSGGNEFEIGLSWGGIYFNLENGAGSMFNGCPDNYADGTWHFMAVVFDFSQNSISCFFDGKQTSTFAITIPHPQSVLGASPTISASTGGTSFIGFLDNINVYSVNLSLISIMDLYNNQKINHNLVVK